MVEKKPTYDEVRESLADIEFRYKLLNTIITALAGAAFIYFINVLAGWADVGLLYASPFDNLPPVITTIAFWFIFLYGLWHIFTRITDIWFDDVQQIFDDICDLIDRFFRAQAKAFTIMEEGEEKKIQKKDQTTLAEVK